MKNKLMLTSALVGSLVAGSSAIAQTTITGSLDLQYTGLESKLDSTLRNSVGGSSFAGMGREAQINIANKGKLNNGMDYAAGFSLEFDGTNTAVSGTTEPATISNEAVYINLISGGTTFHAGIDWIQNAKQDLIGSVGDIIDEVGASTVSGVALNYVGVLYPKESIGAGVVHNFGNGITASGLYVPNAGNVGTGNNGYVKSVAVSCFVAIEDYELFDDELFVRYCRAKAKQQLARVISAFNYNLPGGVQVNASDLKAMGDVEMQEVMDMINGENTPSYFLQWN
jgi:hypothetical protein